MFPASLLALVVAAVQSEAPAARVFLEKAAAGAPNCRTVRVDDRLVRAGLFAPESAACPVAIVAGEPIALRELAGSLEFAHLSRAPRAKAPAKRPDMDYRPALDRLVATRLLVLEAQVMGFDDTPEFRRDVENFRASRLRAALQRSVRTGVKPDPAEVERLYRDAVREWKLAAVLLESHDAVKAFEAGLKAGKGFDALAQTFVADEKAKGGGGKAEWVSPQHMLPEIRAAAQKAKRGVPVGPIAVPGGFVFLRVDGSRIPSKENAQARGEASARSLARREHEALRSFYLSLVAKYANVDEALLKSLDLEAKGAKGFEALLADQRPLVTIRGEKPVTVGDLTREVSMKFFHGVESPIQQKRVNREKDGAFERLLGSRLFAKEAAARKLETRPELAGEIEEYERALAFTTLVERVIAPDVKVAEQDARSYYETHQADYTAPQMYKLDGFAFASAREAHAALDKLKGGTDFGWLRSSAPGQLAPEQRTLRFDGNTVSATALPKDLAKAITGARSGEYRLYSASAQEVYVVRVIEQVPPATEPYPDVRDEIAKRLFNEKLTAAIDDYAGKLRKAQPVEVLVTRVAM